MTFRSRSPSGGSSAPALLRSAEWSSRSIKDPREDPREASPRGFRVVRASRAAAVTAAVPPARVKRHRWSIVAAQATSMVHRCCFTAGPGRRGGADGAGGPGEASSAATGRWSRKTAKRTPTRRPDPAVHPGRPAPDPLTLLPGSVPLPDLYTERPGACPGDRAGLMAAARPRLPARRCRWRCPPRSSRPAPRPGRAGTGRRKPS
jgi:hypothetical protein